MAHRYKEQAADHLAREWSDYAGDERVSLLAGIDPSDTEAVARTLQADLTRRDAGLASTRPARTELPSVSRSVRVRAKVYRGATASEGRRLCEDGCECVLCHRPGKDLGERVATTGRPSQLRNVRAEHDMDRRSRAASNRAAWLAKRG